MEVYSRFLGGEMGRIVRSEQRVSFRGMHFQGSLKGCDVGETDATVPIVEKARNKVRNDCNIIVRLINYQICQL